MGSASSRLGIAESLRPWVEQGMRFLWPSEVSEAASDIPVDTFVAEEPLAYGQMPQGNPEPYRQPEPVQRHQQAPAQPVAPRPVHSEQSQHVEQTPSQPPMRPNAQRPAIKPLEGSFPPPWDVASMRIPEAPKAVITYAELSLDFSGQPDPNRRNFLQRMLTFANLTKGLAVFWPFLACTPGGLAPNPQMFFKGVSHIGCDHVIVFGTDALRTLYPSCDPSKRVHPLDDYTVYSFPSIDELSRMLPHEWQLMLESLHKISLR